MRTFPRERAARGYLGRSLGVAESYSLGLIALTVERAHVGIPVADRLADVVEGEHLVAGED